MIKIIVCYAMLNFAKTTKEYQSRYDEAWDLYRSVYKNDADYENKIKREVVADLIGDYIFTDTDFINSLSTNNRNVFQKIYDEIKYLCKIATAGSDEARRLEKAKKLVEQAYRENVKGQTDTQTDTKGKRINHSLSVKEVNGVEHIVDPSTITHDDVLNYMEKSRKGELENYTYFPVSAHIPNTIISTLQNAGIEITDKSLAMQAKKARQSQIEGQPYKNQDGVTVRHHAMKSEEIIEAIDKLNDTEMIIQQTERTKKKKVNGKSVVVSAPDNFVAFVTLDSGKECVAVIEFDSVIDPKYIIKDVKGEEFHTTVTVFEPDVMRNGLPFDYAEYLLSKRTNRELDIIKESPESETAYSETFATASETELSDKMVSQKESNVKYSLSPEQQEYFKDSVVRDKDGNLKVMYHGTSKGGHTVFDTYGSNYGLFGQGSYFTDNKDVAESYTKKGKGNNPQVYESYLNIKNPIDMDAQANPDEWRKQFPDALFRDSGTNEEFYRDMEEWLADSPTNFNFVF